MSSGVWFDETIPTSCNGFPITRSTSILVMDLSDDDDGFFIGHLYISAWGVNS